MNVSDIVHDTWLQNEGAKFCGEYALNGESATEIREVIGRFVLYKAEDYGNFTKMFNLNASFDGVMPSSMMVMNDRIFLIYWNTSGENIQVFSLDDGHHINSYGQHFSDFEVYGINDNNVYASYELESGKRAYIKLDINLDNEIIISKEDIPKNFDYSVCV